MQLLCSIFWSCEGKGGMETFGQYIGHLTVVSKVKNPLPSVLPVCVCCDCVMFSATFVEASPGQSVVVTNYNASIKCRYKADVTGWRLQQRQHAVSTVFILLFIKALKHCSSLFLMDPDQPQVTPKKLASETKLKVVMLIWTLHTHGQKCNYTAAYERVLFLYCQENS